MMFLSNFTLHFWAQVNFRYLKQQIILISGTTSLFSLSPCPTLEAMLLRNGGHLKQNALLLPTSSRRDRKIFNLYIQRWRPSTLIFVSRRFCSHIYWFTFFSCSRFQSPPLGAIAYKGNFERVVHVYPLSA